MKSATFSFEEFAARRRGAQSAIEEALRPHVQRAVDLTEDTHGWNDLLNEVEEQFRAQYVEESGDTPAPNLPERERLLETLRKTTSPRTEATVDRITVWLATWVLSQATIAASAADPEELFLEWVDMRDKDVREAHRETHGQVRPLGENFDVAGVEMPYPGWPGAPPELWMNCRCTLRPMLASEFAHLREVAMAGGWGSPSETEYRDVPADERKRDAREGRALPDGSFPIDNCSDLRNAIQAIGRAKDPAKAKAHIRKRKSALGCDDVDLPESWSNEEESSMTVTDPFAHAKEIAGLTAAAPPEEAEAPVEVEPEDQEGEALPPEAPAIPWHGVLVVEGKKSGDNRGFRAEALRSRPLPLPLSWQKVSTPGHDNAVVAARIDHEMRVPVGEGLFEVRAHGVVRNTPEADEMVGLLADFGKFGVSIDADEAVMELDEEAEDDVVWFSDAQVAGACVVGIPAFHGAWVSLGEPPEDFYADGTAMTFAGDEIEEAESLVAATFVDVAPGRTEDGPGWLTHPVDTDRLRDYWVRGPGAAKIGWGTAGDFDRCRANVAEYVKPQHINGYCANRHYDALGVWPGPGKRGHAVEKLEFTESPEVLSLVAAGVRKAPAGWFKDPGFAEGDERLVRQKDGNYGCPLTITEDGQVFGHIALWGTCHTGFPGVCTTAPHSESNYAGFLLGYVSTDEGDVPTGTLTIGGGHARDGLSARRALAHYDNVSTAFADVNVGEDEFGIWCAGRVRPGTPEEMIAAARASKLSGDWRDLGSSDLELIAAHAVNTPGFPVARVAAAVKDGRTVSLVAAGAVRQEETEREAFTEADIERFAEVVAAKIEARARRRARMAELAAEWKDED